MARPAAGVGANTVAVLGLLLFALSSASACTMLPAPRGADRDLAPATLFSQPCAPTSLALVAAAHARGGPAATGAAALLPLVRDSGRTPCDARARMAVCTALRCCAARHLLAPAVLLHPTELPRWWDAGNPLAVLRAPAILAATFQVFARATTALVVAPDDALPAATLHGRCGTLRTVGGAAVAGGALLGNGGALLAAGRAACARARRRPRAVCAFGAPVRGVDRRCVAGGAARRGLAHHRLRDPLRPQLRRRAAHPAHPARLRVRVLDRRACARRCATAARNRRCEPRPSRRQPSRRRPPRLLRRSLLAPPSRGWLRRLAAPLLLLLVFMPVAGAVGRRSHSGTRAGCSSTSVHAPPCTGSRRGWCGGTVLIITEVWGAAKDLRKPGRLRGLLRQVLVGSPSGKSSSRRPARRTAAS